MTEMVKKGRIIIVDHGAYADYGVDGIFIVEKDFDLHAMLEEYKKRVGEKTSACLVDENFLAILLSKKLMSKKDHGTLHLGDGLVGEMFWMNRPRGTFEVDIWQPDEGGKDEPGKKC